MPECSLFQYGDEYYTHYLVNGKWIKVFVTQRNRDLKVRVVDESVSDYELEQLKNLILYQFWHDYDLLDFYLRFSSDEYVRRLIKHYQDLRVMRD